MSTKDYSAKLLEMEGIVIENLEESEQEIVLQISLEQRTQSCRRCGTETERVHDYRIRQVRDLELRGKPLRLLYRRRRYVCPFAGSVSPNRTLLSGDTCALPTEPARKS